VVCGVIQTQFTLPLVQFRIAWCFQNWKS